MSTTEQDTSQFRPQRPPAGLTRRERRDWAATEGERIADLQDQARTGRKAVLASRPPKGLRGAGRRAWRKADRQNRSHRWQTEQEMDRDNRTLGGLVLMGLIVIAAVVYGFVGISRDQAAHPAYVPDPRLPSSTAVPSYVPPSTPALDPSWSYNSADAAVVYWYTQTCGNSPEDPSSARLARHRDLMTPEAYAALPTDVQPLNYDCSHIIVTAMPDATGPDHTIADGVKLAFYSAFITGPDIHDPTTIGGTPGRTISEERRVIRQPDGKWLVGDLLPAN